jgi:hypothetical protein
MHTVYDGISTLEEPADALDEVSCTVEEAAARG